MGGLEVSLMALFGCTFILEAVVRSTVQGNGAICRKDVPGGSCTGCIGYFRLYGTGWYCMGW